MPLEFVNAPLKAELAERTPGTASARLNSSVITFAQAG